MNENKVLNKIRGDIGENIAKEYLKSIGYRIVKTNFKNAIGEIDIIAYDEDVLVFAEVKYRKTAQFGLPREAVNYTKQKKIHATGSQAELSMSKSLSQFQQKLLETAHCTSIFQTLRQLFMTIHASLSVLRMRMYGMRRLDITR